MLNIARVLFFSFLVFNFTAYAKENKSASSGLTSLDKYLNTQGDPVRSNSTSSNVPEGWAQVHEKILPGAVRISVSTVEPQAAMRASQFYPNYLARPDGTSLIELGEITDETQEIISNVKSLARGSGGFIQTAKGLRIMTNRHVAENGVRFFIKPSLLSYNDKFTVEAELEWISPIEEVDVAILKLKKNALEKLLQRLQQEGRELYIYPIRVGSSFVGEEVGLTSNPLDQVASFDLGRLGDTHQMNAYSLRELSIANAGSGSSGGLAYDNKGEVVGIVTAMSETKIGKSKGLFFLTPLESIKAALEAYQSNVKKRTSIGMILSPIDYSRALYLSEVMEEVAPEDLFDLENNTANVASVDELDRKGLAYASGLRESDILLGVGDDYTVVIDENLGDQWLNLKSSKTGKLVPLTIAYQFLDPKRDFKLVVFRPSEQKLKNIVIKTKVDKNWERFQDPKSLLLNVGKFVNVKGFVFRELNEELAEVFEAFDVSGVVAVNVDENNEDINISYNAHLVEEVLKSQKLTGKKLVVNQMMNQSRKGFSLEGMVTVRPRSFVIQRIDDKEVTDLEGFEQLIEDAIKAHRQIVLLQGVLHRGVGMPVVEKDIAFYIGEVTQKEIEAKKISDKLF